jgi:hypothetical protein
MTTQRVNNWYQKCTVGIKKRYGGDWELFVDLLAATSPRKQVITKRTGQRSVLNPKPNLELCHATIRIFLER